MRAARLAARMAAGEATAHPRRCHAWVMPEDETVTMPRHELDTLLSVATLYVESFGEDDMMTLPEKFRLQMVEEVVKKYGKRY
jgi:hypothetical protein